MKNSNFRRRNSVLISHSSTSDNEVSLLVTFCFGFFIGFGLYLFVFHLDFKIIESSEMLSLEIKGNEKYISSITEGNHTNKILCWVTKTESNNWFSTENWFTERVNNTWGRRCNKLIVAEDKDDVDFTFHNELSTLYSKYGSTTDWFLFTADNIYVILQNLHHLLGPISSSLPFQIGHALKIGNTTFISTFPGFVLSKEAVHRIFLLNSTSIKTVCRRTINLPIADLQKMKSSYFIGRCLKSLGIKIQDGRDSEKRLQFIPFNLMTQFTSLKEELESENLYSKSLVPIGQGLNCCSDSAIMVPLEEGRGIWSSEYALYGLHALGRNRTTNLTIL